MNIRPLFVLPVAAALLALSACDKTADTAPVPAPAHQATTKPRQFPNALAAFVAFNDYTPDQNTLAITSTSPLAIRISPTVVAADNPKNVREDVRRAFVYAALRVFLHTDAQTVHITSQPTQISLSRGSGDFGKRTLLTSPKATGTITRDQVERVVKELLGVEMPGLLGSSLSPDSWSPAAKRAMHSDVGTPGLVAFSDALGLTWAN